MRILQSLSGGAVASWLVCSTRVVRVRALAGVIVLCFRQDTLLSQCFSSPRCTNGYQQMCWE